MSPKDTKEQRTRGKYNKKEKMQSQMLSESDIVNVLTPFATSYVTPTKQSITENRGIVCTQMKYSLLATWKVNAYV